MKKIRTKKSLGQHLLINEDVCMRIANLINSISGVDKIFEIGPGAAAITKYMIDNDILKVIEIDPGMVSYLKKNYPELEGRIVEEDFLKVRLEDYYNNSEKIAVVGNFPYNISSQIFFKILDYRDDVEQVICMVQKEVAQRMTSEPKKKAYGILSVFFSLYYEREYLFDVSPHDFDPPPKVTSAVIRLTKKENPLSPDNEAFFKKVVKLSFNQRRKTLKNALKQYFDLASVDPDILKCRAEELSADQYIELCKVLQDRSL